MANTMFVKVILLALTCFVLSSPLANAALSCGQIQLSITPCIGYLRSPTPTVPAPCCNGVRNLNNLAKTTPDRQGACRCLKFTATRFPGLNLPALAALPTNCGVNLPYKISPSIDCNMPCV
ncbi:hypothetical protein KIW84_033957 [Lathyrus oleraceus]|uniref:Non-specific lipid-transfer protein n=1 Tax=Pisum sativum TaxID=3888 RepID=A0A9D4XXA4_PEA|nr:hypothetical protein KIW84_033951 [Pisum sativum]KAI5429161.1 hypothetical protein KIW84_033957 [Pisum sativum]